MGLLVATTPRTGKVLFDYLLAGLEGVGASAIVHNGSRGVPGSVIRCTYREKSYRMLYSPLPAPGKVTNVIDVFRHIGAMPRQPRQNIRNMSEQSYNKANRSKRKKAKRAA